MLRTANSGTFRARYCFVVFLQRTQLTSLRSPAVPLSTASFQPAAPARGSIGAHFLAGRLHWSPSSHTHAYRGATLNTRLQMTSSLAFRDTAAGSTLSLQHTSSSCDWCFAAAITTLLSSSPSRCCCVHAQIALLCRAALESRQARQHVRRQRQRQQQQQWHLTVTNARRIARQALRPVFLEWRISS